MKKYHVAIIGYGWASEAHITAINATSRAQVTTIYSSRQLDAEALSRKHGCTLEVTNDFEALLQRPDIDVVSICSYPNQHAAQLIATARAGKHFIAEKPLTLNLEELREVVSAVQAAGVRGCVCHEGRFSGQFLAIKSVIDAGWLGTIHYGELDYYHGCGPWYGQYRWNIRKDAGGSSLLSAGCHAVSSLLLCMGNEVETVTSYTTQSRNEIFAAYEYPTTSVTVLQFKDGRLGKVASVIDCLQPYYRHVHLVGSEGSLLDNRFHTQRIAGLDKNKWSELAAKMLDSGNVHDHPYTAQFEAFFAALERGEDMPLTSFPECLVTHRVVLAADLSAAEGRPVRLAEIV